MQSSVAPRSALRPAAGWPKDGPHAVRTAKDRLKIEHSIIEGCAECWRICWRKSRDPFDDSGCDRPVRDARGKVKMRVTVPAQNGWKAIALSAGARQELFVSTAMGKTELEQAFEKAGALLE